MPEIRPFRGVEYARDGDLTDLVCPPYDVIGPDEQATLLARHDRNAVRLELPLRPDPHAAAAEALAAWLADGTLARRAEPALYAYRHATPRAPDEATVRGVLARLRLEPFGDGVRAHEHTMPGPKADRLAHLHATRTQVSPILGVYFDRSEAYAEAVGRAGSTAGWHARDGDGLLHAVAALEPDERLGDYLSRQRVYIADGHHRYETALTYQADVRADPRWADAPPGSLAADWIMIVLVNAELEELEVLATHRLILDADADALRALKEADPLWQAIPVDPSQLHARLDELRDAEEPVFGLVLPEGDGWLLVGDREGTADRMRRERTSPAVHRLDLAILHASILADRLGIDPGVVAGGGSVAYTRSEADARAAVARGEARAAILVRPTRLDQLAEVASAGEVMPQKSTYFYPKLLTGFVFNPLED
jgi:uncharacterized protein (DUF1015 family)